uniref:2-hydroxyisoflavanone dehydratase-like n=1 Tax=Erigeron canadensis TaxID=72917 RepID=UPI001CB955B4|nr:2-hydroxyisoflavanone dehydratase-like [Erigeron canadensis]
MATIENEVVTDLFPFMRAYKDGTVERITDTPFVEPSPENNQGVCSKDITISPAVSARIYLPNQALSSNNFKNKLPVLVYYHGGAFCYESAFGALYHNYINTIVSKSQNLIVVSVEYRLSPENPLPAAYEDSWAALNWVTSHGNQQTQPENKDQWIVQYANFEKLYLGGDSSGGNIAYNMAIRAGLEKLKGDVNILGGFLSHPYFWGSKAIRSEVTENREKTWLSRIWRAVYPNAPGGEDNPWVNPSAEGAPAISGLGFKRMLVVVAEKDETRDRGVEFVEFVKNSEWDGVVELVEYEGEGHCFNLDNPESDNSKDFINRLVSFIR